MHIDPNEEDRYIERNFFSQDIPVDKRAAVFNSLFFHYKKDWQFSFALMLVVSVSLAALGLSENSAAIIIGAMVIAPLGQPIVALGGAIALGWRIQSLRMFRIILIGSVCCLIISYLIGLTLADSTPNQQMLMRTSPDLRDLAIAVFAGIAGAYGYYRTEFSTILSGFAIAVALVPPLACSGLMLEQQYYILAAGSLLLFITNFAGITLSALLVFFLLGLKYRQGRNKKWFLTGFLAIIGVWLGILFPLALNFHHFSAGPKFHSALFEKAGRVCALSKSAPIIRDISIQGTAAMIKLRPYPTDQVEEQRLKDELERATGLQIFLVNDEHPGSNSHRQP